MTQRVSEMSVWSIMAENRIVYKGTKSFGRLQSVQAVEAGTNVTLGPHSNFVHGKRSELCAELDKLDAAPKIHSAL